MREDSVSAVVLAGGRSSRLGQDKRRLRLWGPTGPTLLERTVATVSQLAGDVVVALNDPQEWPGLPARLVIDAPPGEQGGGPSGPLAGLYAGLRAASHSFALVVAADMPFLSAELLRALVARPRRYDVLALRSSGARNPLGVEPLHAVYRTACAASLGAALGRGERQLAAAFAGLRLEVVEPEEARRYDPAGRSAFNINGPEQLAEALRLIAAW
jgi:molybdenum cofactor guanylyltransferase